MKAGLPERDVPVRNGAAGTNNYSEDRLVTTCRVADTKKHKTQTGSTSGRGCRRALKSER